MRIHILQHVWFEDEACIGDWSKQNGHTLTKTPLHLSEKLPPTDRFDFLVVLGGPMSVNDEGEYPWLPEEKDFIRQAIKQGKAVLGICLGAQLIANVLGARVFKNPHKEIGWHKVLLTEDADKSSVFSIFPKEFVAFHWHGETFDLPEGCTRIARSEACANQAFEYQERVIGLQFHLESSAHSIGQLIQNCSQDLVDGKYVQSADQILSGGERINFIQTLMGRFLSRQSALVLP